MPNKKKRAALEASKQTAPPSRQPLIDTTAPLTLSMQINQSSMTASGPLPPPEILARYDAVSPGLADRLVKMAEAEAAHRRDVEHKAQEAQATDLVAYRRSEMWGQTFGLTIGLAAIGGAVYCAVHQAQWTGSFIGTAGVTGLVTAFIVGRRALAQQREIEFQHQMEATRIVGEQQRAAQETAKSTLPKPADPKQING
jgi:uncharacterized membrane protein